MVKLVKKNSDMPILNEVWTITFYDHKSLDFTSKDDLEKYLNHELSNEHGYMGYERVPNGVEHTVYYKIEYNN